MSRRTGCLGRWASTTTTQAAAAAKINGRTQRALRLLIYFSSRLFIDFDDRLTDGLAQVSLFACTSRANRVLKSVGK